MIQWQSWVERQVLQYRLSRAYRRLVLAALQIAIFRPTEAQERWVSQAHLRQISAILQLVVTR